MKLKVNIRRNTVVILRVAYRPNEDLIFEGRGFSFMWNGVEILKP